MAQSHLSAKKSCAGKLKQIKQIRNCMKRETLSKSCSSMHTRKGVIYIVYGDASKTALKQAQLVQDSAAKVVTGRRKFDHVIPVLNMLQRKKLEEKRKTHRLCFLYKCLNNQALQYFSEKVLTNFRIH